MLLVGMNGFEGGCQRHGEGKPKSIERHTNTFFNLGLFMVLVDSKKNNLIFQ